MNSNVLLLLSTSPLSEVPQELLRRMLDILGEIVRWIGTYRDGPIDAARTRQFEEHLQTLLRELGRQIVEWVFNHLEPSTIADMPSQLTFENECYRLRSRRPHRGGIATLFGTMRLERFLYQPWTPGEPAIFPLERNLGIEPGGATPALALRACWLAAGMTQQQTLEVLRQEHGVSLSVATLRKLLGAVSEQLAAQRHDVQVAQLLELLNQANRSSGSRKIVLSVGRDGVFVPIRKSQGYQEAAAATVAVYDRAGKRLGTVYLGRMPESGQGTISQQLTQLLNQVLQQWEGPLPRLCYVTDAGHHPTEFFRNTLRWMRHPVTGKLLGWEWVVDYFHVCLYVTKLAEAVFGEGKEASAWARKMRRWLKNKPNGAYRVLHSAAALKEKRGLRGPAKQFVDAYRYLRDRLQYLDYVDYRRRGLPIGSGVTEAACKIVFAYRFKQSGMKWSVHGGQDILDLRLLRLSNVWQLAADAYLTAKPTILLHPRTDTEKSALRLKIAA